MTQTVYVDTDRVLLLDRTTRQRPIPLPTPPSPMTPAKVIQPGRPVEALRDPSTSTEVDVRQAIAQRQHRDYLRLVERLKDFYSTDALRYQLEKERAQGRQELEAYEKANEEILRQFVEYGKQRGPMVAELALLVGFPDPNPTSKPPLTPPGNVVRQRLEKAKGLREQIHVLEAQFDAQVHAILGAIDAQFKQSTADLQEEILRYRKANDLRAENEAAAQVRQSVRALGLELAEPIRLTLPVVPAQAISFPGTPAAPPAPQVTSEGVLTKPQDRELLVRRQLTIWAAQNRYSVASAPGAVDKTEDFIAWRKRLLTGR